MKPTPELQVLPIRKKGLKVEGVEVESLLGGIAEGTLEAHTVNLASQKPLIVQRTKYQDLQVDSQEKSTTALPTPLEDDPSASLALQQDL